MMTDPSNRDAAADRADAASPAAVDAVDAGAADAGATRRGALMLGALGVSAVVTIRPALAQTAGSVLNCEIPVPDPARGGWIDAQGRLVPANTPGAFAPAARPYTGQEVKAARARRGQLSGTTPDQNRAYLNYIGRLQQGQSGFTCFASLQMPRS